MAQFTKDNMAGLMRRLSQARQGKHKRFLPVLVKSVKLAGIPIVNTRALVEAIGS